MEAAGGPPRDTLEDSLAGSGLWLLEMKFFCFFVFFSGADRGAVDFSHVSRQ